MDIYKWAEQYDYLADYLDPHTGYIYKVQEYGKNLKVDPNAKIRITDADGNTLGYAAKKIS